MTTLSTLKKTVIVSPSTKLIQANYVKLQLEKKVNLKKKYMKHLLPYRILQLIFT